MTMALSLDDAAAQGRQAITVDDAIAGTWEAPVIEVSTQDEALAEKSKSNLEKIKEKYAQPAQAEENPPTVAEVDPQYAEKLRAEAERQKQAVAEKYGASRWSSRSAKRK
jgi:hypothetical protein